MDVLPPYKASPPYEEVIYVYNVWEPSCGYGDGTGECVFSLSDEDEWIRENEKLLKRSSLDGYVTLTTGQFLLVTTTYNIVWSCCDGYRRLEFDVSDQEPDLESGDYPDKDDYGSEGFYYEVYTYEEALGMVF